MEMKFEDKLAQLETIVEKLEKGQISLDDSLALFEHGIILAKECNAILENARQRVEKLIEEDNDLKSEEFDMPDDSIEGNNN